MINEDVVQSFAAPQHNFEKLLEGVHPDDILFGGKTNVTNPFPDPNRNKSLEGSNTRISWFGTGDLDQDLNTKHHFGIGGKGPKPKFKEGYWTPGNPTTDSTQVPGCSYDWIYDHQNGSLTVTISNDSDEETITVSEMGYRFYGMLLLEDLNRIRMPPESLLTAPLPDSIQLMPGAYESYTIFDVDTTGFVALYATIEFSGNSSDQPYQETVGEWWGGDVVSHEISLEGACCIDFECVATITEAECHDLGGAWYMGETCPEFECSLADCVYIAGDCDCNGVPAELSDVIAMIGMYRGDVPHCYECDCPPHGENFAPSADPNGNCVSDELPDAVAMIGIYRGTVQPASCVDCPGQGLLAPGRDGTPVVPSLKSKVKINKGNMEE